MQLFSFSIMFLPGKATKGCDQNFIDIITQYQYCTPVSGRSILTWVLRCILGRFPNPFILDKNDQLMRCSEKTVAFICLVQSGKIDLL